MIRLGPAVEDQYPLPADLATRPPTARDVWAGICVIIAAASVLAAIVLWHPDNYPAFGMALFAAASLIVAPVMTTGLLVDVRHQKRFGGQRTNPLSHPMKVRPRRAMA